MSAVGACDFIDPVTVNPNAVPEATVDQLFTGVQVNTWFFNEGQLSRLSALWTQQMTGTDRQFTSLDQYIFNEQDTDGEFQALYTGGGLIDLKEAIAGAEGADRRVYAGILKVHEAFLFGMGASIWGDIPYSEAANPEVDLPSLDDQAAVYSAVQALLDEAIADLNSGGSGPGAVDLSFGGSAPSWVAVAQTLKARFHMHWAEAEPSRYAQALAAAQSGIKSASGNWKAIHSTTATENNAWYQFNRDRAGYISAGDHLLPMMRDNDDPRIGEYFTTVDGEYVAPFEITGLASVLNEAGVGAADAPFHLVTCAETHFIMAEAYFHAGDAGNARTAAKSALGCQEEEFGVSLTALKDAFDGVSGDALLEMIMAQKYTAMFLNVEVWNDYKRTCLPSFTPRDAQGVPRRMYYGLSERQTNPNIPEPAQQGARAGRNDNDPNPC